MLVNDLLFLIFYCTLILTFKKAVVVTTADFILLSKAKQKNPEAKHRKGAQSRARN